MQKASLFAIRLDNSQLVRSVSEVAARPSRHQNLHPRPLVFFQEQRSPSPHSGFRGGHQSGSASTDDDNIVVGANWVGRGIQRFFSRDGSFWKRHSDPYNQKERTKSTAKIAPMKVSIQTTVFQA